MTRPRKRQRGMIFVNLALVVLFLLGLWAIGLSRYVGDNPKVVEDKTTRTDAIVVLTGGSGRLNVGLNLLSRDLADLMFVSGVYHGLDVRKLLHVMHHHLPTLETRVNIGNAINTRENAEETAKWVQ